MLPVGCPRPSCPPAAPDTPIIAADSFLPPPTRAPGSHARSTPHAGLLEDCPPGSTRKCRLHCPKRTRPSCPAPRPRSDKRFHNPSATGSSPCPRTASYDVLLFFLWHSCRIPSDHGSTSRRPPHPTAHVGASAPAPDAHTDRKSV